MPIDTPQASPAHGRECSAWRPSALSRLIWRTRYRAAGEADIEATWRRVASALARAEPADVRHWEQRFYEALDGFRFLPAGRVLAGAGIERELTLFNCFVMGPIPNDVGGVFDALREGAVTLQHGGGIGCDFSTLRPALLRDPHTPGGAPGALSFLHLWDSMCATWLSRSTRRGAMMGTLRCDHPDILAFIDAKRRRGELRNFNLSVLVSDALMAALDADAPWPLVFPVERLAEADRKRFPRRLMRPWPGQTGQVPCAVIRELSARQLWETIMRANFDTAEPGVLFIDRMDTDNNLGYRERIAASNPCGEVPLPYYGACNLGSLNLPAFVRDPFTGRARLDMQALSETTATAVRMLDDVIDVSRFPLPAQAAQAHGSRRIGLGITGLADALILLGLRYDCPAGRMQAANAMQALCQSAYRASIDLAAQKGPFPFLERDALLARPFVSRLPPDIRVGIRRHGLRNSHLTAIAPAGTISLLADNLSSGVEPVFARQQRRALRGQDGRVHWHRLDDPAVQRWQEQHPGEDGPPAFVAADEIAPDDHLAMQAVVQNYVDNAVSKTINVPAQIPFDAFEHIYRQAYRLGLKGCTTFRPNPVRGAVLARPGDRRAGAQPAARCCDAQRGGD